MAKPVLYVGNQNYSSWSLRPYMALKQVGIPFDLKLILLDTPQFKSQVKKISPAGRVPVLVHGKVTVWDTLAILEYVAEHWPDKNLWPTQVAARAHARAVSAEMHSGFQALRNACPMNIRRPVKKVPMNDAVLADIKRIDDIWSKARKSFGKGGPFLFGKFSVADAMYAPVASRCETYTIKLSPTATAYKNAILASDAFRAWKEGALKEKWVVPHDEVD
jgi:glutathione S-transferase